MSPGFMLEMETKTPLNKRIQGVDPDADVSRLASRYPSSDQVATSIISAVEKGEFVICPASFVSWVLFSNMVGPSPKRGFGIIDSLMSIFVGWIVWPILRRRWEAMCTDDGVNSR